VLGADSSDAAQPAEADQARRAARRLVGGLVIERERLGMGRGFAIRQCSKGRLDDSQGLIVMGSVELRPAGQTLGQVLLPGVV
jgi:hypothetical protein